MNCRNPRRRPAVARITYQYNDRQIGASYLLHKVAGEDSDAAVSAQAENVEVAAASDEMSGAKVQTASIESGGSAQDSGAEYGSDAAQSGALDGESSFNQDPLALAQTDPLTSSESAEKKTLSSARRPGFI